MWLSYNWKGSFKILRLFLLTFFCVTYVKAIDINGVLDEKEWDSAQQISDFTTIVPYNFEDPKYLTNVKIFTNQDGIYVGFINEQDNICTTGDVYVYGTLRTSSEFVRIRINDIKVNNNLKILNKDESTNPLRTYEQFPVRVVSTSNNCAGNKITLTFLEEINIKYILIKNPNQSDNSNLIKSYTITAYS